MISWISDLVQSGNAVVMSKCLFLVLKSELFMLSLCFGKFARMKYLMTACMCISMPLYKLLYPYML